MTPIQWSLLTLFPSLGIAALLMIVAPLRRLGKPAAYLSVAAALTSLVAALMLFSQVFAQHELGVITMKWLSHDTLGASAVKGRIELGILLDGVSVSMLVVVCLVASCVQIFSLGYMAEEPDADYGRYFTYQSLFIFAMNSLVIAPNLLQLFLGWELVGLVSYLLIGFYYKKPSAAKAAVKAFWVTKFADMGLLLGLIVLFVATGTFDWTVTTASAGLVTLLLFIAVMGKSAQFPLHIWLPDAMEGPTPVSALLHAATMVAAGVYMIVRAEPLFAQAESTRLFMTYIGGFTALFAACIAVVQDDIKKVLAYSTCSQLGYMVCALGAGSQVAGYFHLTTHAFFKALLFLAAGSLIHGVHSNSIRDMGGLWSRMKLTSITFIIGAAALAGIPGFSGFFSKDLILEEVAHAGHYAPFAALMLAAFLTAFYMGRVVFIAIFGEASEKAKHAHESGASMLLPLVVLAALALGAGFPGAALSGLYAEAVSFHPSAIGVTASSLGLAGLGMSYWMFAKGGGAALRQAFGPIGQLARSGAIDKSFAWSFQHVLLMFASLIAWFDRYVIDGLINVTAYGTLEAGKRARPIQTGNVQMYVYAVVVAFVLMSAYGIYTV